MYMYRKNQLKKQKTKDLLGKVAEEEPAEDIVTIFKDVEEPMGIMWDDHTLMVGICENSAAARAGCDRFRNRRIAKVNGKEVKTLSDIRYAVEGQSVVTLEFEPRYSAIVVRVHSSIEDFTEHPFLQAFADRIARALNLMDFTEMDMDLQSIVERTEKGELLLTIKLLGLTSDQVATIVALCVTPGEHIRAGLPIVGAYLATNKGDEMPRPVWVCCQWLSEAAHASGCYLQLQGVQEGGMPVYQHIPADHWMYSTPSGHWAIVDDQALIGQEVTSQGYVMRSTEPHRGAEPFVITSWRTPLREDCDVQVSEDEPRVGEFIVGQKVIFPQDVELGDGAYINKKAEAIVMGETDDGLVKVCLLNEEFDVVTIDPDVLDSPDGPRVMLLEGERWMHGNVVKQRGDMLKIHLDCGLCQDVWVDRVQDASKLKISPVKVFAIGEKVQLSEDVSETVLEEGCITHGDIGQIVACGDLGQARPYLVEGPYELAWYAGTSLVSFHGDDNTEATTLEGERTTANAEEMDAVLQDAWDPVFRAYKDGPEPPYPPFAGRYQRYIDGHPQEVGEITGTELRALLTKKGVKGACGIDGWRMAELKALPDLYLESLATLLNLVERTGIWPQAMRTALVSMIPKGDDGQPLNMRPITVTSCVYRLWACRRLKDVAVWQESWVEEGQHGFRPGHRGEDPLFTMTLEIERALLSGEPLCGLSLDFSKCFDRVPREIALRLMQDLGLHSRILKPLKSIYDTLVRRFKLPLGVGKEFQVTNGILQGCPISVILINALLSVLMKAVKVEAPGVSTQSYADDANLLAKHSEADLQRGADLVDEFCALTGMSLNMEKTVTFATGLGRRTKIFRSSTGEQFAQKESLKCLGAKVSTSRSGRDHFDSSRFEAAATTARNLRHVPIPRQQKTLIVQSAILPAALARISFAPPTTEAVEKLATALTRAIWGPKNPKRSSEVVLGVLEKAHLTHPATATAYRITADFYSACGRLPHLMPLMTEVRRLYGERVTAALGPVGTAVRHGLQPCGHTWNGGPPSSVNLDGAALRPLAMSASSRNHIIRDNLRNRLWKRLETRRPSFSGITNIAIESTNALWTQNALLIRVALAGGVNTAEYTSRFRQGGSPACTLCGSGALEDEHHVYWDCTAFENIRTKPEYAGIAQSDRRLWPSCLREHGIVTPATREFAGPVQALMAEILAERARRISVRWLERKAATPWERCAQMPTAKREFPFRRIAPAWAWLRYWDEGTFLAAIDWLSGLEWSSDGDMAAVEAAIDFELFSGLDIKAPSKAAKTHREKANGMRCMLSAINKLAVQQQLGKCLPGDFKSKTTALSFIGLSSVPGFQPRPRHRMPETGPTIMQQVKTGYGTAPAYPPERTDRARRWVIPRAPLANPDPLHLPHAVPEATKNAPKCATHHKGKCAVCRALGHHHGPTVEACCRHHHADNDGLPPAVCDRHRMTRCVECNTPTACCKAGHHDCREHARGPCDDCRGLPTLAERRPSACCKKGHHVPAPPKPAPAKPKPTTPRKKGRQKPTTPPRMKRTRQASPKAAKMAKKHAPTEPARATPPRKGQKRARLPTPPNDPAGKPGKKHAARKRNISRMELDITSPATSTSSSS
ncbi:putative RNA-directed DNA polymerase from transposon X-element, partial [Diplonema papillatum]